MLYCVLWFSAIFRTSFINTITIAPCPSPSPSHQNLVLVVPTWLYCSQAFTNRLFSYELNYNIIYDIIIYAVGLYLIIKILIPGPKHRITCISNFKLAEFVLMFYYIFRYPLLFWFLVYLRDSIFSWSAIWFWFFPLWSRRQRRNN